MNGLKVHLIAAALSVVFYGASYFAFHPVAKVLRVDTGDVIDNFIDNPFEVIGLMASEGTVIVLVVHSIVMISGITFAVSLSLMTMFRVRKEEG